MQITFKPRRLSENCHVSGQSPQWSFQGGSGPLRSNIKRSTIPIIVLVISGANLLTGPRDFAARADSPKRGVRFAARYSLCRTGRLGRHSSRAARR